MAGTITALRFQKQNKDRVSVFVDGEYSFSVPALVAVNLRKNQYLSDDEIAELRATGLRAKAYDKAVRFLAVRPRSTWEVRQNLRRYRPKKDRPLNDADIDWVVEKLTAQGYLDDTEFARYWIEQRNRFKPMSPRALRYELRQKGVDNATIESILASATDPAHAALQAARTRLSRWRSVDDETFRKKMIAFLQRRGFNWAVIRDILEQIEAERGTLD
jgi:regulatory protein